jgi:serine/threonine protein kinase
VQIGSGSFGVAYAAKSTSGGPIVYKRFSVLKDESEQFEDELACHNALRARGGHPNVLMALKTFRDSVKQEAVLVMEAGVIDLQGLLKTQSYCLAAPLASMLLQDITQGLSFIHKCGIIHRDLKPCNVLLCASAHQGGRLVARISDFGCSRLQSVRPTETLNFCTCWYRAPEVFELVTPAWLKTTCPNSVEQDAPAIGSAIAVEVSPEMEGATELAKTKTETKHKQELMRRYSFAADVWSLGCVFAEFLHGRILFQTNGSTDISLLATIAARIGLPAEGVLAIKGWPDDRVLDLAKASRLVSTCAQHLLVELCYVKKYMLSMFVCAYSEK